MTENVRFLRAWLSNCSGVATPGLAKPSQAFSPGNICKNTATGICIGIGIAYHIVIVCHQREYDKLCYHYILSVWIPA